MGANYLDSIIEIKKGGNYLPPFSFWELTLRQRLGFQRCCRLKAVLTHR